MYYQYNNVGNTGIAPTKQAIKDYICLAMGADSNNVEVIEDFETLRTRHICQGSNIIQLLEKRVIPVPTTKGIINVEIIFCGYCRKLIINRSSMEVY